MGGMMTGAREEGEREGWTGSVGGDEMGMDTHLERKMSEALP